MHQQQSLLYRAGFYMGHFRLFLEQHFNTDKATILGVVAFSSFWSILEVIHQRERVRKGWFPEGPGHRK